LTERVVPDPYFLPRHKEMAMRIEIENKHFRLVLDLKYGFPAMCYYKDHGKCMAVISPSGVFVPTRLGLGGKDAEDL